LTVYRFFYNLTLMTPDLSSSKRPIDAGKALPLRPSHERILEAFAIYGAMAPDELAERIGRSALYVRPRCSELRAMGLLRATGESRRNPTSGLSAVVLAIVTSP
jgi:hypothetical protein